MMKAVTANVIATEAVLRKRFERRLRRVDFIHLSRVSESAFLTVPTFDAEAVPGTSPGEVIDGLCMGCCFGDFDRRSGVTFVIQQQRCLVVVVGFEGGWHLAVLGLAGKEDRQFLLQAERSVFRRVDLFVGRSELVCER